MKKIFAIALALVMVLSMASAFASQCTTGPFDWSCAVSSTKCGKATIEVIPLVKVNDACGTWKMEVSTCAAAVTSNEVYYAVKLTIPKDIDPEWYNKASLTLTEKGINTTAGKFECKDDLKDIVALTALPADDSEDGWVYYLKPQGNGTSFTMSAEQTEAIEKAEYKDADVYKSMVVGNASKANVCAKIESKSALTDVVRVGDYYVRYFASNASFYNGAPFISVYTLKTDKVTTKSCVDIVMDADSRKVGDIVCTVIPDGSSKDAEISKVLTALNLGCGFGVCITEDALKANFGWKDKQESCFSWSDKAAAVVDAECVVAIPKTGDKGLLWWLF